MIGIGIGLFIYPDDAIPIIVESETPPPSTTYIVTDGGDRIVTDSGDPLITD